MRTTLTLEPDVVVGVKTYIKETQAPFKTAVNELIRRGCFSIQQAKQQPKKRIKLKTFNFGLRPELKSANFNHLAFMSDEEIVQEYFNKTK